MSPPTSESGSHPSAPRSEGATLRAGLSLAVAIICVLAVGVALLAALASSASTTGVTTAALGVATVLAVTGLALGRRPIGSWVSVCAIGALILAGLAAPTPPVDELVMGTYTLAYISMMLSSRSWGLAWIGFGIVLMSGVVTRSTVEVEVGGVAVPVGIVAVIQMVVAGGWLWWAWNAARAEAGDRDRRAATQEESIADAVSLQERTRAWREAITRTHETILNDLRYVLHASPLDRERLRVQLLATRDSGYRRPVETRSVRAVTERLREEFPGEVVVGGSAAARRLTAPEGLEPTLAELVRNVARHSDATRIVIDARLVAGELRVEITDDGSAATVGRVPGIGRSVVVGESLDAMRARLDEGTQRSVVTVPLVQSGKVASGWTFLTVLSVVLVGSSLGGSLQFLLLVPGASLGYLLVAAAACALTATATAVALRRRPIGWAASISMAALAAVVAWGLAVAQVPCAVSPLVLTTLNLSLNALFGALLWARSRAAWWLTIPAFAGVLALDVLPGAPCSVPSTDMLLSSAVLVPVFILVSWFTARRAARWEADDRRRREVEMIEQAAAEADSDLAQQLEGSVDQTWALLWEVASGADLDDARRHRLRCLEALIRATIQTDPRTAGGITLAAHRVVADAVARGVPVQVRSLRGSRDARPLSADLVGLLSQVAAASADAPTTVRAFFDGLDDYLAVTTTAAVATAWGLHPGLTREVDDTTLEAEFTGEESSPDAEVTVLLRREALGQRPAASAPESTVPVMG